LRLCWLRTRPMCRGDLKTGSWHIGIDKRPNSNCSRITSKPAVIGSSVGLVPRNAPAMTDQSLERADLSLLIGPTWITSGLTSGRHGALV
jgi:hypothetical protein